MNIAELIHDGSYLSDTYTHSQERLENAMRANGGHCQRRVPEGDSIRWVFPDGSAITLVDDATLGWDWGDRLFRLLVHS